MKVLFITISNPFGVGGGDYATHAYLLAISKICNANVDVFVREGITPDGSIKANFIHVPQRNLPARIISIFKGHLHRNVKDVLKRLTEGIKYDYCIFNSSRVSTGLIKQVKSLGIKTITIHHNVDREYILGNTPNPFRRALLAHLVVKAEREAYLLSDCNLFLTQQDMQAFHRYYGKCKAAEHILGVFEFKQLPEWENKDSDINHLTFAITGSLDQMQGIDGVRYFFSELYQFIPKGAKLIVSGRNPTPEVIELCSHNDNVKLIPNPKDMNEVINQADVYICPTRLGGGLKLRIMDGLRLGLPVISHACSARGYDDFIACGGIYAFTTKEEFATSIKLLQEKIQAGVVNRSVIRRKYEDSFSFPTGLTKLRTIIESV